MNSYKVEKWAQGVTLFQRHCQPRIEGSGPFCFPLSNRRNSEWKLTSKFLPLKQISIVRTFRHAQWHKEKIWSPSRARKAWFCSPFRNKCTEPIISNPMTDQWLWIWSQKCPSTDKLWFPQQMYQLHRAVHVDVIWNHLITFKWHTFLLLTCQTSTAWENAFVVNYVELSQRTWGKNRYHSFNMDLASLMPWRHQTVMNPLQGVPVCSAL